MIDLESVPKIEKHKSAIVQHYTCSNNQPAYRICTRKDCPHPSICCQDDDCQCNHLHFTCTQIRLKTLLEKLYSKVTDTSVFLKKVTTLFDSIIDQVSQIYEESQKSIKRYGLRFAEIKFLEYLEENRWHNLTGKIVHDAYKLSEVKYQGDFRQIQMSVDKLWDELGGLFWSMLYSTKDLIEIPTRVNRLKQTSGEFFLNGVLQQMKVTLNDISEIKLDLNDLLDLQDQPQIQEKPHDIVNQQINKQQKKKEEEIQPNQLNTLNQNEKKTHNQSNQPKTNKNQQNKKINQTQNDQKPLFKIQKLTQNNPILQKQQSFQKKLTQNQPKKQQKVPNSKKSIQQQKPDSQILQLISKFNQKQINLNKQLIIQKEKKDQIPNKHISKPTEKRQSSEENQYNNLFNRNQINQWRKGLKIGTEQQSHKENQIKQYPVKIEINHKKQVQVKFGLINQKQTPQQNNNDQQSSTQLLQKQSINKQIYLDEKKKKNNGFYSVIKSIFEAPDSKKSESKKNQQLKETCEYLSDILCGKPNNYLEFIQKNGYDMHGKLLSKEQILNLALQSGLFFT